MYFEIKCVYTKCISVCIKIIYGEGILCVLVKSTRGTHCVSGVRECCRGIFGKNCGRFGFVVFCKMRLKED